MNTLSERLHLACDKSKNCPSKSRGRQVWLAETLDYSIPAVNKWFKGHSEPPLKVLKVLAELLEVDPAWLILGVGNQTQKPVFPRGEDYNAELGRYEKVPEPSRRAAIVYAWMARCCIFGVPFSPVKNKPNVDAVIITDDDCWDVYMTELHSVQSHTNAKNYVEWDGFDQSEGEHNLFKTSCPPKDFHGLVAGVVCYELPRANQFRLATFHSDAIWERAFDTDRGWDYCIELKATESILLPPLGSKLKPVDESKFRQAIGLRLMGSMSPMD